MRRKNDRSEETDPLQDFIHTIESKAKEEKGEVDGAALPAGNKHSAVEQWLQ